MIYDSALWFDDIDRELEMLPELHCLQGKSVLITGANGLICSAIVDLLLRYNRVWEQTPIRIYVAGRSEERMTERFCRYLDGENLIFVPYDAAKENAFEFHVDYIIHGASNAFPDKFASEPVETMVGNFCGIKALLEYAKKTHAQRVLYISSSEVYGKKNSLDPFDETQYGYVDILNPRSAYPISKRASETLCVAFASEYGVDTVIVRPGHIYGPTASIRDNRVSSAWAYDAAAGRDIVLKSDGAQIRSYCYCLDCASAILKVLLCGKSQEAYNISNPDSVISIREMAEFLAESGECVCRREAASENEARIFNPMQNSSLNSDKLIALGWHGVFDAKTGLEHTVRILRDSRIGMEF